MNFLTNGSRRTQHQKTGLSLVIIHERWRAETCHRVLLQVVVDCYKATRRFVFTVALRFGLVIKEWWGCFFSQHTVLRNILRRIESENLHVATKAETKSTNKISIGFIFVFSPSPSLLIAAFPGWFSSQVW